MVVNLFVYREHRLIFMSERILITGGAGFIGRIVGRELLDRGYEVRVLDSLIEQVHGGGERPEGLDDMELLVGDICDASCVRRALANVDAVIHLAAEVGVGQSMRSEEHTSELQSLMRISYAVFCLKKKT